MVPQRASRLGRIPIKQHPRRVERVLLAPLGNVGAELHLPAPAVGVGSLPRFAPPDSSCPEPNHAEPVQLEPVRGGPSFTSSPSARSSANAPSLRVRCSDGVPRRRAA